MIGQQFVLTNPKNSLCLLKERQLNYKFAIIEKIDYLSGESNSTRLGYYNKNILSFINKKTNKFDGAYGPRIYTQLKHCFEKLKKDQDSRQAVINIYDWRLDMHESNDIPCTLSLQFLLRKEKLNLIVTMRSNDLLWGFPYDVNAFCFLQEVMASWLNKKLGIYIHQNGSTHIYLDTFDKFSKIINNNNKLNINYPDFKLSFEETQEQYKLFWKLEKMLRNKQNIKNTEIKEPFYTFFKKLQKSVK